MTLTERISAFCELGHFFREYTDGHVPQNLKELASELDTLVKDYHHKNAWFTEEHIVHALCHWGNILTCDNISGFLSGYNFPAGEKTIALIMPGNIPFVGFHDYFCILISGNKILIKPSTKNPDLPVFINKVLCTIEPRFSERITFTDEIISNFDAIIATGSNKSADHFEQYFSKYPHIIRRNRTSVTVLTGNESKEELEGLAEDMFRYFGLGCRNVTKMFVPQNYNFEEFFGSLAKWHWMLSHNKWANNYDYHKSVYLMNRIEFLDGSFFILKKDEGFSPPLSVIFYEHYSDICILATKLKEMDDQLQCVVSKSDKFEKRAILGATQLPALNEFADGTDSLRFLCNL